MIYLQKPYFISFASRPMQFKKPVFNGVEGGKTNLQSMKHVYNVHLNVKSYLNTVTQSSLILYIVGNLRKSDREMWHR